MGPLDGRDLQQSTVHEVLSVAKCSSCFNHGRAAETCTSTTIQKRSVRFFMRMKFVITHKNRDSIIFNSSQKIVWKI